MQENYKIYDISLPLVEGMICYPKDVPYKASLQRSIARGDSSNVTQIELSAHTGSHVDSPFHFVQDSYGVDKIPLEQLYGPARVIDCRGKTAVTADELVERVPAGTRRILLKTDNSALLASNKGAVFNPDFVYLGESGARFCLEHKIILVGIDYLSIDKSGVPAKPAHHILLGGGITILEGICLENVSEGEYFLACGPLKMVAADGAPARVVLFEGL